MKPLVKVYNSGKYEIVITDITLDSDEYVPETIEDAEIYYQNNKFKYSETNTVNIILKTTTDSDTVISTLVSDHTSSLDEAYFTVDWDGHFTICHLILPTIDWLEAELKKEHSVLDTDMSIYVCDCEHIYYYTGGQLIEKAPEDIVSLENTDNTTISRIDINKFSICYLYDCYIAYCKQIFRNINFRCLATCDSDLIFKRDFLWMTINVIKYYVEMNQLSEAQRILEEINYCGGLCNQKSLQIQGLSGCGCNK